MLMEFLDYLVRFAEAILLFIVDFGEAWDIPLIAIVIAILLWKLRIPIFDFLEDVESLRAGGFELTRRKMQRYIATAGQVPIDLPPQETPPIDEEIQDSASINARGVMIEAWLDIEEGLFRLAEAHNVELPRGSRTSLLPVIRSLVDRKIVEDELNQVIQSLRRARNLIVHRSSFSPDEEEALEFVRLARQVVAALSERHPS